MEGGREGAADREAVCVQGTGLAVSLAAEGPFSELCRDCP